MAMTSRDRVRRAIAFDGPDRMPMCTLIDILQEADVQTDRAIRTRFPSDIMIAGNADPGFQPAVPGQDQWGCVWETFGATFGEVKFNPIASWDSFDDWKKRVPDFSKPERYLSAWKMREENPDRYLMGGLGFLMMDLINLRGYAECMMDPYLERENLDELVDILYLCASDAVNRYAEAGMDAVIAWEDWGLQDRLMMNPTLWREVFLPRMSRLVDRIHERGMKYVLHSCGYILDIVEDLIGIGVDVLQLDQQRLMGFERLKPYVGRICFFNPVDIQFISGNQDLPAIRSYALEMVEQLSTPAGGFMYKTYSQPRSVEIPFESLWAECDAFASVNPYRKTTRVKRP